MEPMKQDHGKNRWDLLPIREVEQGVEVLTAGSIKYSDDNWKAVVAEKPGRYWAALFRHITARLKGEKLDPETGLPHLAHALCCLWFLMWNDNNCSQT